MNPRMVSRFMAQQMLYDHMTGTLDEARKDAVDEFLKTDNELAAELKMMSEAKKYLQGLQKTDLAEPLYQEILNHRSRFSQIQESVSWRNWPDNLKWGVEAFSVAVLVAVSAVFVPWDELRDWIPMPKNKTVIESPVAAPTIDTPSIEPELLTKADGKQAQPIKEEPKPEPPKVEVKPPAPPPPVPKPEPVVAKVVAKPPPPPAPVAVVEEPTEEPDSSAAAEADLGDAPVAPPAPVPPPVVNAKVIDSESKDINDSINAKTNQDQPASKGKGILYRMFMSHKNIDEIIPLVVQEVEKLGGQKAGNVSLGYKKDNSGYFHFTIPEPNYEQLMNSLRYFGPVQVQIDAHTRVMPKGTIRIILMVEPGT